MVRKTTKKPGTRKPAFSPPPPPSEEAIKLGALEGLMALATGTPFPTHKEPPTFQLRGHGGFEDEFEDTSVEQVFARMVARGESFIGIAAAIGITSPIYAAALVDLCRGARVDWTHGKAVA